MIDDRNIPRAYAETLAFIDSLDGWYKAQIPQNILDVLETYKNPECVLTFRQDGSADLSKEALALVAGLNLKYWCQDGDEKRRLWSKYEENTGKEELAQYQSLMEQEQKATE